VRVLRSVDDRWINSQEAIAKWQFQTGHENGVPLRGATFWIPFGLRRRLQFLTSVS